MPALEKALAELRGNELTDSWIGIKYDLGTPINTLSAIAYDLLDYLQFCDRKSIRLEAIVLREAASYAKELRSRGIDPRNRRNRSGPMGLATSTIRRRLSNLRQFYDFLVVEGACNANPFRIRAMLRAGKQSRSQPWIPTEEDWQHLLRHTCALSLRNRTMFALSYDLALRSNELCSLLVSDFDHAHRTVSIRAEVAKNGCARVLPYGEATNVLLIDYLRNQPQKLGADQPIFLSESNRNRGSSVSTATWSKVIKALATASKLPKLHPHTLRHLSLTDLARSGWDVLEIKLFAGHRSLKSTEVYIHLSGRELKEQYAKAIKSLHASRSHRIALQLSQ